MKKIKDNTLCYKLAIYIIDGIYSSSGYYQMSRDFFEVFSEYLNLPKYIPPKKKREKVQDGNYEYEVDVDYNSTNIFNFLNACYKKLSNTAKKSLLSYAMKKENSITEQFRSKKKLLEEISGSSCIYEYAINHQTTMWEWGLEWGFVDHWRNDINKSNFVEHLTVSNLQKLFALEENELRKEINSYELDYDLQLHLVEKLTK